MDAFQLRRASDTSQTDVTGETSTIGISIPTKLSRRSNEGLAPIAKCGRRLSQ